MSRYFVAAAICVAAWPVGSLAQTVAATDEAHGLPPSDIIVTAPYSRNRFDILTGVSVLDGEVLTREVRSTLGETLAQQPGVSATSFGPNASRPILRGFQGERIRVLDDGIGTFDVSNTSVDHAVAINPLLVDRIEVLHGPTSLLYGSSAIGGVVNLIGSRIPRALPDAPVHFDGLGTFGSAANEFSFAGALNAPIAGKFVAHVDGSYYTADDLKIGGYVLSDAARAEAIANGNFEAAELKDVLPNSAATNWDVAGGFSYIGDGSIAGISVNHLENDYGVPIRYALAPGEEQEAVSIALEQTRVDALAYVETNGGFIDQVKVRWGYADYQHSEIDAETGEVGTTFYNKGQEGRLELVQTKRGEWTGATGGQYIIRDFNVVGDEAFLPKNTTFSGGLFTLQEYRAGNWRFEGAARYEITTVQSQPVSFERTFRPFSASIGASMALAPGWRIGLDLSHTGRAPAAEELLANGPHAGTQAYEVGDPNLDLEVANGAELTVRGTGTNFSFDASFYYQDFSNYIYLEQTGAIVDGLPEFITLQGPATYWGFEIQGNATIARWGEWALSANLLTDYVNAQLKDVGPAPYIPPLRILGGLGIAGNSVDATVQVEWANKQTRVAPYETPTDGYVLLNLSANWRPFKSNQDTYIVFSIDNILNEDARRASSYLKDYAPLAGRDFRVALRAAF